MLKASDILLRRIPQARLLSTTPLAQYAAAERKVRVRVVSNKKNGGKPKRGPGTHMTFRDMTSKLNLNKDAVEPELDTLLPETVEANKAFLYTHLKELHHLGSFNRYQYNELWKSPISVSRESTTLPILEFLNKSKTSSSLDNRLILLGDSGSGKTTVISQFHSLAKSQGAIILHFNDCTSLINGTNDYVFDPKSGLYQQPMYLNKWLRKFKKGNLTELGKLKLSTGHKIAQYSLSTRNSLVDLVNIGLRLKGTQQFIVWDLLIEELKLQTQHPVYLTVDRFSEIVKRPFTEYRDAQNQFLYFDKFTFGKFIIDHISGQSIFNNGGVVVGTNGGRQPKTLTVPLGITAFDPYEKANKFNAQLAETLTLNGGLQQLTVPRFSKAELGTLLDELVKSNIIQNDDVVDVEKLLDAKYVLSGNGNPYEFYKSCVLKYY